MLWVALFLIATIFGLFLVGAVILACRADRRDESLWSARADERCESVWEDENE